MQDLPPRRNIKLVISYNGAAYHGWQRQAIGFDTVQLQVESVAGRVVGHPVTIFGASRTDAGVHAQGQVANFYSKNFAIPLTGLRRAMNSKLPKDIAIRSAVEVPDGFHSSRSACGKTYRYRIHVGPTRPVMLHKQVYHYWRTLDLPRMREATTRLVGTHDFVGFASSAEDRATTVRTIYRCDVADAGQETHVTVEGNGFLYNMVRNIVGTLVDIGRGYLPPGSMKKILKKKDRTSAGPTAPAKGLFLIKVKY